MLIGEKFILLELQKTGCSHTRKILVEIPSLSCRFHGMHNRLDQVTPEILGQLDKKIIAGNIRNPWDWYVSLWAYGLKRQGGLYEHLAAPGVKGYLKQPAQSMARTRIWKPLYAGHQVEVFRKWLRSLLHTRRSDLPEGYGKWQGNKEVGFLTYRFLHLFTAGFHSHKDQLIRYSKLLEHYRQNKLLDFPIRNESLEKDVAELARRAGAEERHIQKILELNRQRTNASARGDYRPYYDEETRALVAHREKLIIEEFDYRF